MSQEIDYEAVLADLETRKAALEAAIEGIKQLRGQPPSGAIPAPKGHVGRVDGPEGIGPGTFFGMTKSEAAKTYLEIVKKKQKTGAICEALQRGGIESSAKNLYSNIFTMLKRNKEFAKVGKYWGLASWFPKPPAASSPHRKRGVSKKGRRAKRTKEEQAIGPTASAIDPEKVVAA